MSNSDGCCHAIDGSSFAFAAMTMEETDPPVEDLGNNLMHYEHLQHLNFSKNGLRDISSIAALPYLLTVNVATNAVASIKFLEELGGSERLQFLQVGQHLNLVTALSSSVSTLVATNSRSSPSSPSQD